jgi:hypothetical protein
MRISAMRYQFGGNVEKGAAGHGGGGGEHDPSEATQR